MAIEAVRDFGIDVAVTLERALTMAFDEASGAVDRGMDQLFASAPGALNTALRQSFNGASGVVHAAVDEAFDGTSNAVNAAFENAFSAATPTVNNAIHQAFDGASSAVNDGWERAFGTSPAAVNSLLLTAFASAEGAVHTALEDVFSQASGTVDDALLSVFDSASTALDTALTGTFARASDTLNGALVGLMTGGPQGALAGAVDGLLGTTPQQVADAVRDVFQSAPDAVRTAVADAFRAAPGVVNSALDATFVTAPQRLSNAVNAAFEPTAGAMNTALDAVFADASTAVDAAVDEAFAGVTETANQALNTAFDQTHDTVNGALEGAFATASETVNGAWASVFGSSPEALNTAMDAVFGSTQEAVNGVLLDVFASAQGTVNTALASAFAGAKGTIKGVVDDAFGSIRGTLNNALQGAFDQGANLAGSLGKLDPRLLAVRTRAMAAAAGTKAMTLATTASAKATTVWATAKKGAAVAARAFNTALRANPLGLILTAITAVVGALTWFFTQTESGKQIWATVWSGIQSAMATAWQFIQPIWDGFLGALGRVGEMLNWLWVEVVQPVFALIGAAFQLWWTGYVQPIWNAFTAALEVVGSVLNWLWESVVQPVIGLIAEAISLWWNYYVQPIWNAFTAALEVVGSVLNWLWETVVQPVIGLIGDSISAAWSGIKPVWDGFQAALQTVGAVFRAMWEEYIKPAWETFQTAFQSGWDTIKNAIETGEGWFEGLRTKIEEIINKISDLWNSIKIPEPIARALDSVGSFFTGGDDQPEGKASGGYISGPGTGTSDSILARLSNGEFVINAASTRRNRPLLEAINNGAVPGYATGGLVTKSGLIELAKQVDGKPYEWGGTNWGDCSGAVSALANYVAGRPPFDTRFWTGNQAEALAQRGFESGLGPSGSLRIGWYTGGPYGGHTSATLPNGVNFEMGGKSGNGQYGGTAVGANAPAYTNHAHFVFDTVSEQSPASQPPTTGGESPNQNVDSGDSDLSPAQQREAALFDDIVSNFQNAGDSFVDGQLSDIRNVFGAPSLDQIPLFKAAAAWNQSVTDFTDYRTEQAEWEAENGRTPAGLDAPIIYDPNRGPEQFLDLPGRLANSFLKYLVPSRYDNGGWLQPGLTLVENKTGKPEPVFNPQQWSQLSELAQPGGTTDNSLTIENLHTGMTAAELRRELNLIQKERSLGFVRR
ncbi:MULTISPECIES: hypothetical protein [unclassified Nocardia]|uniref:phage tail protein n=1 Tax=unclassified Nocardia TaxID=2637762 RepID=UPI00278C52B8|nr:MULTISPECIES: hypothetical protein [unclassified Nocardia]